ncbi:hypothetical protein QTP81_15335 [Alteromonas sp. ASW11-36]|uniref:Glycosyltransferase n=1 Tax=Alteromonas arenosi TaxID=3055817 RepID=A0ABT7T0P1_9ALTE|nr:hypothetical protein [Alteromonas sp. ASW11-36]MDM7861976.1 hypothetical protein [Alteromonas sp. ASW11-36]
MHLVYIGFGIDSAFVSQSLTLLNQLSKDTQIRKIDLLIGKSDLGDVELNEKIDVCFFERYPVLPVFCTLMQRSIENSLIPLISSDTVIHCRTDLLGAWVAKIIELYKFNNRVVIDVRGLFKEELKGFSKQHSFLKWLRVNLYDRSMSHIATKHLKHARVSITAVTESLLAKVKADFSKSNIVDFHVVPCVVSDQFEFSSEIRESVRKELNIPAGETVLIMITGSGQQWQNESSVIQFCEKNNFRLIMLSKQTYDSKNVISAFVPYNHVARYLCAADAGFILRDDHVVNNVALPIKSIEYWCTGLPIISDGNVWELNRYSKELLDASFISFKDGGCEVSPLSETERLSLSEKSRSLFSIREVAKKYVDIYRGNE